MASEPPTTPVDIPAEFYVLRHGEMFGPFREEQLRKGVEEGHFAPEDFVQIEGQEDWRPLGRILGMDEEDLRGAVAPDWNSILKWAWLRLRYNLGEQSLAAGCACLGIGTLALALSQWPFVFWLPWFGAAVVAAIPLIRRKREVHGALLLVGVVCIPFLFVFFGSKNSVREAPLADGIPSATSVPQAPQSSKVPGVPQTPRAPNAPNAPQAFPENQATPFPAMIPEKPQAPGAKPAAASQPATAQSAPDAIPGLSAPEPLPPHYAPVPPEDAPATGLPSNPAVPAQNPAAEKPHLPEAGAAPAAEVDFAHEHGDALVIVKGAEGSGSGFICSAGNRTMLFTNTHVIADLSDITVTQMDGGVVSPGATEVAAGRDIARLAISHAPAHPLEAISDFNNNVRIGDAVVVLGNSGGGGVVTKIDGQIVGIGPDRIEVSAEFIPGNSGSPIIHVKTGQVIGIATYLTKRYEEFSSSKGGSTPAPSGATPSSGAKKGALGAVVVRRFGYRIDNVPGWEPVEWSAFLSEAASMRQISTLTGDIFDFLGSLHAKEEPKFATETLRRPATEWLASLQTKHVSDFDRQSSTRGFLNSLRFMVRNDVATAEPRLRYTYFRNELKDERRIRDRLYKSFDEQSAELSEPVNHPTSVRKSH